MKKIVHVVGARPNFMKAAPVMTALGRFDGIGQRLVHTGQHYDDNMAESFFADLGLPRPDYNLGVRGNPGRQDAIEARFAEVLTVERPDVVVVYGDVDSTVAAARATAATGIPVAHVEAGLRSFDLSMPEEVNRIAIDGVSTLLLTSSREADDNLKREEVKGRIHFVGNVMIDTLLLHRNRTPWDGVGRRLSVAHRGFGLLTLHRPANVDDTRVFGALLDQLEPLTRDLPIVFPVHPRTARQLSAQGLADRARCFITTSPLGYLDFLALMDHAACVFTDSGGIQEETTVLGVPCFTIRNNTERPVTVEEGTNTLVGATAASLPEAFRDFQRTGGKRGRIPEGWDGEAAGRVAQVVVDFLFASPLILSDGRGG